MVGFVWVFSLPLQLNLSRERQAFHISLYRMPGLGGQIPPGSSTMDSPELLWHYLLHGFSFFPFSRTLNPQCFMTGMFCSWWKYLVISEGACWKVEELINPTESLPNLRPAVGTEFGQLRDYDECRFLRTLYTFWWDCLLCIPRELVC